MDNLEFLQLRENRLAFVPIDAISILTKLKVIDLSSNEIQEISNGVFDNNLNLEEIQLNFNKIKFLGLTLFNGLTKLNYVNLNNNICINKDYRDSTQIYQLVKDIQLSYICTTTTLTTTTTTTTEIPTDATITTNPNRKRNFLSWNQIQKLQNGETKEICLDENKPIFLDSYLFDGFTKLDLLDLWNSVCLNPNELVTTMVTQNPLDAHNSVEVLEDVSASAKMKIENPPDVSTIDWSGLIID
ncbi:unnamed protein product [Diamesa serratosioi]